MRCAHRDIEGMHSVWAIVSEVGEREREREGERETERERERETSLSPDIRMCVKPISLMKSSFCVSGMSRVRVT
jgi:hypothetical protein